MTQAEIDARTVLALKALLYRLTQVRQLAAELVAGDPIAVTLCAMLERTPASLEQLAITLAADEATRLADARRRAAA